MIDILVRLCSKESTSKIMRLPRIELFKLPGDRRSGADDWLISPIASKAFLFCTICVVALTPFFMGSIDTTKMTFWQRLPWGTLGLVGGPAIIFLWFGMWRYWMRVDHSNALSKRAWFLVLLLGFWWGSALYNLCVYLPQTIRRKRNEI